ncbi:hypothetical protein AMURIS_03446 [Acetatifactor muris]|jgi:hypothetical protein|uniref:PIN-like domain-containing protein n=2 Tax=Acetatifactor muris TaxID=879566 RepID=A0A2K4ZJT8_9FIRM|nr:hypothetical protein AMURIS_03446 [Acetatifactor muris]
MFTSEETVCVLPALAEESGIDMFHFMIDLENTRSRGLQGAEYLSAEDCVTIFYSQSCLKVECGKLQQIMDAGSILDICRLKNTGKNALDFYITSKTGALFGSGYQGTVAIVSNDKGYHAVRDYWKNCVTPAQKVVVQADIEQCILVSDEASERRKLICEKLREVNLETQYKCYEEQLRIRHELEACFADTAYKELLGQIVNIVKGRKGNRLLYLDTIKQFGRKRGLEIYTRLRQVV